MNALTLPILTLPILKSLISSLVCVVALGVSSCSVATNTTTKTINPRAAAAIASVLKGTSYDPPGSTMTADKPIFLQTKRSFVLEKTGVTVSNELDGGRLSDVRETSDSTLSALIMPENTPINSSAWYAFKLWKPQKMDTARKTIAITLQYAEGQKHRYEPKMSRDRTSWLPLAYKMVSLTEAVVHVPVSHDTIWVAGQELFTSRDFERWADSLATSPATAAFVKKGVVGKSVMGRTLHKFIITEAQAGTEAGYAVLLCRQHPPEVTGTIAFKHFVETLTGNSELARRFRKTFAVVVVPCVNPDGVDMGHWRHNAHGIDLNRDWDAFRQPETRAVSEEFLKLQRGGKRTGERGGERTEKKIFFGIDFHSTSEDVFYVIPQDTSANAVADTVATASAAGANGAVPQETYNASYKRIKSWLARIQAAVPTYAVNADESPDNLQTPSSNRWMNRVLGAATTTYEVGDTTDRTLVRDVAQAAARAMMEEMLAEVR